MNWYRIAQFQEYPLAGQMVGELTVLSDVPNASSIESSLDDYIVFPGIREVPMSDFNITGKSYSVSENDRIEELAKKIGESSQISPLIVVVDREGPYILEGSHRADALYLLGIKTFPALVVKDDSNELV